MTARFDETMRELHAEYENTLQRIERMQEGLNGAIGKAKSKNRMVSAVVDGRGELAALKLHGQAWRTMAPGELCTLITQTIGAARQAAQQQVRSAMGEHIPDGLDVHAMLNGQANWTKPLAEAPELPRIIQEMLATHPPNHT